MGIAQLSRTGLILGTAFVFILSVCRADDPLFLGGLAAALILGWLIRTKSFRMSAVDWAVVAVLGAECALLTASVNMSRSFIGFKILTQSILFYFILRIGFRSEHNMRSLLGTGCVVIGIMAWIAIVSFALFYDSATRVGFEEIYHFRSIYRPLGYLTNAWGSVLIGFLAVTVLALWHYRHRSVAVAVILFTIVVPVGFGLVISFSRGVYLALFLVGAGVLASMWMVRQNGMRIILMFLVASCLCAIALWPFRTEVLRTVGMTSTISQQRSIDGRMLSEAIACKLFKERPIAGIGAGNYSLGADPYLYQDTDRSFTSFAPDIISQLLVEKGAAGTAVWGVFGIVCLIVFLKQKRKNALAILIAVFLLAIVLREGTFPVFFEYSSLQVIVFTLLAVWQNNLPACHGGSGSCRYATLLPVVASLAIFGLSWNLYFIKKENAAAVMAVEQYNLSIADSHLRSRETLPSLINRSSLNWLHYDKTGNPQWLEAAERDLREAVRLNPRDVQLVYRLACVLQASGQYATALQLIEELVDRFPNNAQYNWTLGCAFQLKGFSEKAQKYLVTAIRLMPDLLNSQEWSNMTTTDTLLAQSVKQALIGTYRPYLNTDPIKLAKYGEIYYFYGEQDYSFLLLSEALKQLPNLSYPWYYLGMIFLNRSDTVQGRVCFMRAAFLSPRVRPAPDMAGIGLTLETGTPQARWMRSYRTKFVRWYQCQMVEAEYTFR